MSDLRKSGNFCVERYSFQMVLFLKVAVERILIFSCGIFFQDGQICIVVCQVFERMKLLLVSAVSLFFHSSSVRVLF